MGLLLGVLAHVFRSAQWAGALTLAHRFPEQPRTLIFLRRACVDPVVNGLVQGVAESHLVDHVSTQGHVTVPLGQRLHAQLSVLAPSLCNPAGS